MKILSMPEYVQKELEARGHVFYSEIDDLCSHLVFYVVLESNALLQMEVGFGSLEDQSSQEKQLAKLMADKFEVHLRGIGRGIVR
jgi:hypothetical protein